MRGRGALHHRPWAHAPDVQNQEGLSLAYTWHSNSSHCSGAYVDEHGLWNLLCGGPSGKCCLSMLPGRTSRPFSHHPRLGIAALQPWVLLCITGPRLSFPSQDNMLAYYLGGPTWVK